MPVDEGICATIYDYLKANGLSEVATALKKNAKLTDKTVRSMDVSAVERGRAHRRAFRSDT